MKPELKDNFEDLFLIEVVESAENPMWNLGQKLEILKNADAQDTSDDKTIDTKNNPLTINLNLLTKIINQEDYNVGSSSIK